jgi:hypothetical protein
MAATADENVGLAVRPDHGGFNPTEHLAPPIEHGPPAKFSDAEEPVTALIHVPMLGGHRSTIGQ